MTILGPEAIRAAIRDGRIMCDPAPAQIETHIDVTLGPWFWWPRDLMRLKQNSARALRRGILYLDEIDPHDLYELHHADEFDGHVVLMANATTLVHTAEQIGTTVPDLLPMMHTRSTVARWGCSAHRTAGLGDAGYAYHWTGEMDHTWPVAVALPVGTRIGSITFLDVSGPGTEIYTARYNRKEHPWTPDEMLPRAKNLVARQVVSGVTAILPDPAG